MEILQFADIEQEFMARTGSTVWCNVASVDRQGRPRSRVLHPIWEVVDGSPVGWIATRRHTLKAKHFEQMPYVSLAYIADPTKPVYVDCHAGWESSLDEKVRIWEMFKAAPAPLGYDPAPIFTGPDHENFGLIKLTPWRIEVTDANVIPPIKNVWHSHAKHER